MKKLACIISLALASAFLLPACSLNGKNGKTDDIDRSKPIISIGEESISFAMYSALFDNYLPYMQYAGNDPYESEDSLQSYKNWLIDILTDDLVTLHQAKKSGFTLNAEQEAQLSEETESELTELYNSFMRLAEQDFADDSSIPVSAYFEGAVNSESEYYTGTAMSWEDYKAYYREQARSSAIVKAYRDLVCQEFLPEEDDISDWYDSAVNADRETYTADPGRYKTDEEEYERYFGVSDGIEPVTYAPSGYSRIMQIVVTPEGELSEEYSQKLERMEEIRKEYGELAFDDDLNNTGRHETRMNELMTEYRALKEATDAEYEEYTASARAKINEALAAINSGEEFADVMLRYTEDTRIIGTETAEGVKAFREKGELISLEYTSSADWSAGIKDEFAKLSIGERSNVFMEGGSFRIIYYASDEPSGAKPLESLYEDIREVCASAVRDEQWAALVAEWKKDPALTIDEELLKIVGQKEENNA